MSTKEKVLESITALLPEEGRNEVLEAVTSFMEDAEANVEEEYKQKQEQSFREMAEEIAKVEKTAEEGYAEAYQMIQELRDRLEIQKEEFEKALEEGYEEAYQMILAEKQKNESISTDLYDEYDKKLGEIKEYIVDKVDEFLRAKGPEFYEMAKTDVLNHPLMAEHKVALDRILEVASQYLSDDDYLHATSSKVDKLAKETDDLKGQVRILEAKNMRLSTENSKLNEAVRHQNELLIEGTKQEKNERLSRARTAEGRGQRVVENQVVIGEHRTHETVTNEANDDQGTRFVEQIGEQLKHEWKKLAGLKK